MVLQYASLHSVYKRGKAANTEKKLLLLDLLRKKNEYLNMKNDDVNDDDEF